MVRSPYALECKEGLLNPNQHRHGRFTSPKDSSLFHWPEDREPTCSQSIFHRQKVKCVIEEHEKGLCLKLVEPHCPEGAISGRQRSGQKYVFRTKEGLFDDMYVCFEYGHNRCFIRWNKFNNKRNTVRYNTFYRNQLKWIFVAYKPEDEPSPSFCRNYEMYRHHLFLNFLRCVQFTTKISRNRIWRAFQRSITDPRYAICKNRLRCEFALLNN